MKFKSSEQLIARVSEQLSSFSAAGLLDEGSFYRWIKEILTKLNIPAFTPVHAIIELDGNKVHLPDDMYQFWSVSRYEMISYNAAAGFHYQGQSRWIKQIEEHEHCVDGCNDFWEEPGNVMVVKEYVENAPTPTVRKYNAGVPIRVVNYEMNQCARNSVPMHNTPFQAHMTESTITFNFEGGSVYLQYFKMAVDEDGLPMIPDVTEIEFAIEMYITFRAFQQIFANSTVDVYQKMQYFQNEYRVAYDIAKSWVKLPTARSLVDYARRQQGKYNMFELKHSRE